MTKETLEDIITEWRDFERDFKKTILRARTKELKALAPELEVYITKYHKEVYTPIRELYFKKVAKVFKEYRNADS